MTRAHAKDDADYAAEAEEIHRQEAVFRAQWATRLPMRHSCYNCGEPCEGLFCDRDCRRDYERRQGTQQRQSAQQRAGGERPNAG